MKKPKYLKDGLLVFLAFTLMFFAVSGDGFADLANKAFWWNFWNVACVVGWLGTFGGWLYLVKKDRAATKAEYEDMKSKGKIK